MPIGVEEIERVALGPVRLPDLRAGRANALAERAKILIGDREGDMGILGQRAIAHLQIEHQRYPYLASEQVGALRPLGDRLAAQRLSVESEGALDIANRERDMVDTVDHVLISARTI